METINEEHKTDTETVSKKNDSKQKYMLDMMKSNLTDKSYKLTQQQIIWIENYITINPKFFTDIYMDMIYLIDDNCVVDLHEIPLLIKIFVNIFQDQNIKHPNYKITDVRNVIAFMKYCFKIFIDYQFIIINNAEKNVVENIIDNSLDLLAMTIVTTKEECEPEECCVCFSDFFTN